MVRQFKRGHIRSDGKVFWGYVDSCIDGERWLSCRKFEEMTNARKERLIKKRKDFENLPKPLQRGDVRSDGKVFMKYSIGSKDFEWWVDKSYIDHSKKVARNHRMKKRKDPIYNMKDQARHRIFLAFQNRGYKKESKTEKMLGCDFDQLKAHIESKFTKGMSWDNYGEWHIDHILPLGAVKTKEDLTKLCHHKNLQPLWAEENRIKGDRHDLAELKQYLESWNQKQKPELADLAANIREKRSQSESSQKQQTLFALFAKRAS